MLFVWWPRCLFFTWSCLTCSSQRDLHLYSDVLLFIILPLDLLFILHFTFTFTLTSPIIPDHHRGFLPLHHGVGWMHH